MHELITTTTSTSLTLTRIIRLGIIQDRRITGTGVLGGEALAIFRIVHFKHPLRRANSINGRTITGIKILRTHVSPLPVANFNIRTHHPQPIIQVVRTTRTCTWTTTAILLGRTSRSSIGTTNTINVFTDGTPQTINIHRTTVNAIIIVIVIGLR